MFTNSNRQKFYRFSSVVWAPLIVVLILTYVKANEISKLGNNVLLSGNVVSEENSMLAARDWQQRGFWRHVALPKYTMLSSGPWGDSPLDVYTHYPPGSEWTAYAMSQACGIERTGCWRMAPLALGLVAIGIFISSIFVLFETWKAALISIILLITPTTTHMLEGLGYESYAQSLLLLELSAVILWATSGRINHKYVLGCLFAISFTAGLYSLDYIVLMAASPIVLALFLGLGRVYSLRLGASAFAGFLSANFLHFIQVVWFYGSFRTALADFSESGMYRCCESMPDQPWGTYSDLKFFEILNTHLTTNAFRASMFGFNLEYFFIVGGMIFMWPKPLGLQFTRNYRLKWSVSRTALPIAIGAFSVSSAWTLMFRQHSAVHIFTSRHFFFAYIMFILLVLEAIKVTPVEHSTA